MNGEQKTLEKQLGTMDCILALIGVFLLFFTVAMVLIFCVFQTVPDTLIISVFGACGLECGVMGAIKNRKESIRAQLREMKDGENDGSTSGQRIDR